MSDHPQPPLELQREVKTLVEQTRTRSGWPASRTLTVLEIRPASYYRWCQRSARSRLPDGSVPHSARGSMYEILEPERREIVDYVLKHPAVRHRELAWSMVDDDVCAVSSSTVYRVLQEANLVCRWKPRSKRRGTGQPRPPARPDQLWQND